MHLLNQLGFPLVTIKLLNLNIETDMFLKIQGAWLKNQACHAHLKFDMKIQQIVQRIIVEFCKAIQKFAVQSQILCVNLVGFSDKVSYIICSDNGSFASLISIQLEKASENLSLLIIAYTLVFLSLKHSYVPFKAFLGAQAWQKGGASNSLILQGE